MFFTNCPLVSKLFLMTLRRNLKRKTQSKVYIMLGPLNSVRLLTGITWSSCTTSHLQEHLPLSALPPGFGGSNLAAENHICMGGTVPRPFWRHQPKGFFIFNKASSRFFLPLRIQRSDAHGGGGRGFAEHEVHHQYGGCYDLEVQD